MDEALQRFVWRRALARCEYCQLPQGLSYLDFEIDHIIALKHEGPTMESNLALACFYCNSAKGPNIAGIDRQTGAIVRLFHPRRDRWRRHFDWDGPRLVGKTRIARATIAVLEINDPDAIELRRSLIDEGLFPPV
jgi:hypothetical protein